MLLWSDSSVRTTSLNSGPGSRAIGYTGALRTSEVTTVSGATGSFEIGYLRDSAGRIREQQVDHLNGTTQELYRESQWYLADGRLAEHSEGLHVNRPSSNWLTRRRGFSYDGPGRLSSYDEVSDVSFDEPVSLATSDPVIATPDSYQSSLLTAAALSQTSVSARLRMARGDLGTLSTETRENLDGTSPVTEWESTSLPSSPLPTSVLSGGVNWDGYGGVSAYSADPVSGHRSIVSVNWSSDARMQRIEMGSDGGHASNATERRYYDAFGRAVLVDYDGELVQNVYLGATVVHEKEVADGWSRTWWLTEDFDRAMGYTLARNTGPATPPSWLAAADVVLAAGDTKDYVLLYNFRGDSVGLVDPATGQPVEMYRYDAHGELTVYETGATITAASASSHGNVRHWAMSRRSPITGLHDMRARHYSPALRQFLSPDPLGYVDSFDLWLFVAGDPINSVDPFGLESQANTTLDSGRRRLPQIDVENRRRRRNNSSGWPTIELTWEPPEMLPFETSVPDVVTGPGRINIRHFGTEPPLRRRCETRVSALKGCTSACSQTYNGISRGRVCNLRQVSFAAEQASRHRQHTR